MLKYQVLRYTHNVWKNKTWRKIDSSFSQTDRQALFVGQPYDLKRFVSVFLNMKFPKPIIQNAQCEWTSLYSMTKIASVTQYVLLIIFKWFNMNEFESRESPPILSSDWFLNNSTASLRCVKAGPNRQIAYGWNLNLLQCGWSGYSVTWLLPCSLRRMISVSEPKLFHAVQL